MRAKATPRSSAKEVTLTVLLPVSTFALFTGTFPTDAALLRYFEQTTGLATDSASKTLSLKTDFAMCFIIPVVLQILAFGPRFVMFAGAIAQLVCALLWIPARYFDLTGLSGDFSGYSSAAWIASCCYGKHLVPNEYYVLYCVCFGCAFFAGQFLATFVYALVQTSFMDPLLPLLLAVVSSALSGFICLVWIPYYQYIPQDAVYRKANSPRSLSTRRYWRQMGSTLLVPIKKSPLLFFVLCFALEYAVVLSIEAETPDSLLASSENGFENWFINPLFNGDTFAFRATIGAASTAVTLILTAKLYGNRTDLFIAVIGVFMITLFLALQWVQGRISSAYAVFVTSISLACLQLAAGLVKLTTNLSFELNAVLYGAIALMANYTKMVMTRQGIQFALHFGVWIASVAGLWFAVALCHVSF